MGRPDDSGGGRLLDRDSAPWPRLALGFAAALLALPALQLIPLPPALWQSLPGREAEIAALALIGEANRWLPWTVSPPRTLAALLALIPPAVALVLAARASLAGRRLALVSLVAMVARLERARGRPTGGWTAKRQRG